MAHSARSIKSPLSAIVFVRSHVNEAFSRVPGAPGAREAAWMKENLPSVERPKAPRNDAALNERMGQNPSATIQAES